MDLQPLFDDLGDNVMDLGRGRPGSGMSWPKVKKSKDPKASWSFVDGIVGAFEDIDRYLITSPNSDYIPELPYGFDSIKVRADARFGVHDPIQWPQVFCPTHKWLACILRKPQSDLDPKLIIWRTPTTLDFDVTYGNLDSAWGVLSKEFGSKLEAVIDSLSRECLFQMTERGRLDILQTHCSHMKQSLQLLYFPATFRDVVRQVAKIQRLYLYTHAILDWNLSIAARRTKQGPHRFMSEYIGAFTTDYKVASTLHFIGIRVWFLRLPQQLNPDIVIKKLVEPILSGNTICVDDGDFGQVIHFGKLGLNVIDAIDRYGGNYLDIDNLVYDPQAFAPSPSSHMMPSPAPTIPRSTTQSSSPGSRPSQPKPYSKRRASPYTQKKSKNGPSKNPNDQGRDKRSEPPRDWVPDECPAWAEAVRMLPLEEGISAREPWLWHVPEPTLVFNANNPLRRNTYVRRWVIMRYPLVHALQHPAFFTRLPGLSAQHWRTALLLGPNPSLTNVTDSRNSEVITQVREYFRALIPANFPNDICPPFFSHDVPNNVPPSLCRKIAWELYELGFRQGLRRLDRHLVRVGKGVDETSRQELLSQVYPDGGVCAVSQLPYAQVGLAAAQLSDRAQSLDALRRIFKRWPDAPQSIQDMLPLHAKLDEEYLKLAERTLAQYYCQVYRMVSGRVPIVPRKFPFE